MNKGGDNLGIRVKTSFALKMLRLLAWDLAGATEDNNFMACSWKGVCENPTVEVDQVALLIQWGYGVHVPELWSWPLVSSG